MPRENQNTPILKREEKSEEKSSEILESKESISTSMIFNGDDSSDEEDDYKDQKIEDLLSISHILEDEGRRILYSKQVRQKYYVKKKELLSYEKNDFTNIDAVGILRNALVEAFKHFSPNSNQDDELVEKFLLLCLALNKKKKRRMIKLLEKESKELVQLLLAED